MGQKIVLFADPSPFRIVPSRSNLNFPEHHALLGAIDQGCHASVWLDRAIDRERFGPKPSRPGEIDPNAPQDDPCHSERPPDFAGGCQSTMSDRQRPPGWCLETPSPPEERDP